MNEKRIEVAPGSTGLVIVDMQVEGCERHGPTVQPVISNIRLLLDRFRQAGSKIIHVQSIRSKDHPEFTVFGRKYDLLEGSPGVEFVPELKPFSGEPIVQKRLTIASIRRRWNLSWKHSIFVLAGTRSW